MSKSLVQFNRGLFTRLYQILGFSRYHPSMNFMTQITNKPRLMAQIDLSRKSKFTNPPIFEETSIPNLKRCWKYGGYRKFFGNYFWLNRKLKYFNFEKNVFAGLPQFITSSNLVCIENIEYEPNRYPPNQVSKYTFSIKPTNFQNYDIEQALSFNIGGSDTFQHFIQDTFPILAVSIDFLTQNPNLVILIEKPKLNFESQEFLVRSLGIKNRIVYTNKLNSIRIRNLYYWNFKPYNARLILPIEFHKTLYEVLHKADINNKLDYLTLVTRNETTRNFGNEEYITEFLNNLAIELNLNFIKIDSSQSTIYNYKRIFARTKILIAMHGGACYNSIYLNRDSIFFEFIPINNTNSVLNFVASLGITYVPVPVEFSLTQSNPIHIENQHLDVISRALKKYLI